MTTPIDREIVERLARHCDDARRIMHECSDFPTGQDILQDAERTLLALRAALDAAEGEVKRLRDGLVELRDDPILHKKAAYMRRRAAVILKENPHG